jgi:uracil-DNA glycosylase
MSKLEAMEELARVRKNDRISGYQCLGDFHDGAYVRHNYVSPWSITAHNLDAEVMVLLQDWSSTEMLERPLDTDVEKLGYTPGLATNKNLMGLLKRHFGKSIEETYVTNLFVFIKRGDIGARIRMLDAVYCAEKYAKKQIEIVQPRVALCAGSLTFNALRLAMGEKKIRLTGALAQPIKINSTFVYGVPHPGGRGTANAGGAAAVEAIWSAIAKRHFE